MEPDSHLSGLSCSLLTATNELIVVMGTDKVKLRLAVEDLDEARRFQEFARNLLVLSCSAVQLMEEQREQR